MKATISTKSSKKLADFLEKTNLHKKDFAQMIGVTLSYVYNLIDNTIPFSTRGTTLERIATVMEVEPEVFEEYRLPQEPILIDETVSKIKSALKSKKMKVVDFLKAFTRLWAMLSALIKRRYLIFGKIVLSKFWKQEV